MFSHVVKLLAFVFDMNWLKLPMYKISNSNWEFPFNLSEAVLE